MTETIRYAWGDSSLGNFIVAMSQRGIVALDFTEPGLEFLAMLRQRFPGATLVEDPQSLAETVARVSALIERPERTSDLALDLRGSDFELRVWAALKQIPPGMTASYGEIAARIGAPRETREVGEACASNRLAILIPCHRVVKKDGTIAGYRWGVRRKRALLAREQAAQPRMTLF